MKKQIKSLLLIIIFALSFPQIGFAGTDLINVVLTKANNIVKSVSREYQTISIRLNEITEGKWFSLDETSKDLFRKAAAQMQSVQSKFDKIGSIRDVAASFSEANQLRYAAINKRLEYEDKMSKEILKKRNWAASDRNYGQTGSNKATNKIEGMKQDLEVLRWESMGAINQVNQSVDEVRADVAGVAVSGAEGVNNVLNGDNLIGNTLRVTDNISNALGKAVAFLGGPYPVGGQPDNLWLTPLGDENIENTALSRCRIIKIIKPGTTSVFQTKITADKIISQHASDLYYQAVKTNIDIDKEEKDEGENSTAELTLLNRNIIDRLARITTRMNIIVSLEARTASLRNINKLTKMHNHVFSDYEYDPQQNTCSNKRR